MWHRGHNSCQPPDAPAAAPRLAQAQHPPSRNRWL
jgi:hypothetical protein